ARSQPHAPGLPECPPGPALARREPGVGGVRGRPCGAGRDPGGRGPGGLHRRPPPGAGELPRRRGGRAAASPGGAVKGAWLVLLLCACGPGTISAVDRGKELTASASLSDDPFNQFACTTCHQVSPDDNRKLPGYSLLGAAKRPSYWGGAYLD